MPVVEVSGLNKTFGSGELAVHALRDINFSVNAGELAALLGPSGSGKSTLLLCMSLILEPSSGRVVMNGQPVYDTGATSLDVRRFRRENIGFIFQAHNLIPFLNARGNISLVLYLNGRSNATRRAARRTCWSTWKSATAPNRCPPISREASSSALRSRGRSPTSRR
jgi:putative ABC transport system ATP-binding protein